MVLHYVLQQVFVLYTIFQFFQFSDRTVMVLSPKYELKILEGRFKHLLIMYSLREWRMFFLLYCACPSLSLYRMKLNRTLVLGRICMMRLYV